MALGKNTKQKYYPKTTKLTIHIEMYDLVVYHSCHIGLLINHNLYKLQ